MTTLEFTLLSVLFRASLDERQLIGKAGLQGLLLELEHGAAHESQHSS